MKTIRFKVSLNKLLVVLFSLALINCNGGSSHNTGISNKQSINNAIHDSPQITNANPSTPPITSVNNPNNESVSLNAAMPLDMPKEGHSISIVNNPFGETKPATITIGVKPSNEEMFRADQICPTTAENNVWNLTRENKTAAYGLLAWDDPIVKQYYSSTNHRILYAGAIPVLVPVITAIASLVSSRVGSNKLSSYLNNNQPQLSNQGSIPFMPKFPYIRRSGGINVLYLPITEKSIITGQLTIPNEIFINRIDPEKKQKTPTDQIIPIPPRNPPSDVTQTDVDSIVLQEAAKLEDGLTGVFKVTNYGTRPIMIDKVSLDITGFDRFKNQAVKVSKNTFSLIGCKSSDYCPDNQQVTFFGGTYRGTLLPKQSFEFPIRYNLDVVHVPIEARVVGVVTYRGQGKDQTQKTLETRQLTGYSE